MNRSKLYEWLLDNDCPWDFDTDESEADFLGTCTLVFSEKEEEKEDEKHIDLSLEENAVWDNPEAREEKEDA